MKQITRPLPLVSALLALMLTAPAPSVFGAGLWRAANRRAHPQARNRKPQRHRTRPVVAPPFNLALGPGSWCWFASPQAIRIGSQTIAGYVDNAGDIIVASLVAGVETHSYVLHADLQIDDHSTPTFWERPDGRIVAFYSKHAIGNILYRVSVNPGDITSWGPEYTVPDSSAGGYGDTYPNPVYVPAEHRLYLYFRGASWHPTMTYSDDWGATWAPTQELVNPGTTPGAGDAGHTTDRPYARYAEADNQTYIAFTNAHPQSRPTNIYLMVRRGAAWYSITGQPQTIPASPSDSNMVFNAVARGLRAWVWDVEVGADGDPVVVFATFQEGRWGNEAYWYARWTGVFWDVHEIISGVGGSIDSSGTQPAYSPGIAIDPQDPSMIALSRKVFRRFRVEVWQTADVGRSWRSMPLAGTTDGMRPIFVHGDMSTSAPEILYLDGVYGTYSAFGTLVFDTRQTLGWAAPQPQKTQGTQTMRCYRGGTQFECPNPAVRKPTSAPRRKPAGRARPR